MGAREFGDEMLARLLTHVMESIPGASGVGLGLPGRDGPRGRQPRAVAAVGVAGDLDRAQWAVGQGPLVEASAAGTAVLLPSSPAAGAVSLDLSRWPELLAEVSRGTGPDRPDPTAGLGGLVITPGEWGGDSPVIFSLYLDSPPDHVALEQVDRFEPLLAEALALVEYCAGEEVRAQQMLQMVQYRRVIEQAKGMLMAVLRQDAATAFTTLARASQHFNIRLRNLAVALVEHVGGGPAERPDDPSQTVEPSVLDRQVAAQVWAALSAGANGVPAP